MKQNTDTVKNRKENHFSAGKRVKPNIPRAGIKNTGSRYCGGGRKKACGGKKSR